MCIRDRLNIKKKLSGNLDITNRVAKFVDCRSKDTEQRELFIVEGDSDVYKRQEYIFLFPWNRKK